MTAQERVIATARAQVGYFGKKTNAQLDAPAANKGGKWNKYARDLDALGDFYNGKKNGTGYSLGYYKAKERLFSSPKPGDQIFFGDTKSTWHTGLVVEVSGGYVHTVEGNAGSPSAVRACRYKLGSKSIKGYGRPDWGLVPQEKPAAPEKPAEGKEEDAVKYKTLADVPEYYRAAVAKAVEAGALKGTGNGEINVSEDLCRTLTILDRMGKLD